MIPYLTSDDPSSNEFNALVPYMSLIQIEIYYVKCSVDTKKSAMMEDVCVTEYSYYAYFKEAIETEKMIGNITEPNTNLTLTAGNSTIGNLIAGNWTIGNSTMGNSTDEESVQPFVPTKMCSTFPLFQSIN